ncbi:hypothetical protein OAK75_04400 [Bacteriovoracales bacterium]|nr:hypothetical protein [Bacteriovoracales bacterium]
MKNYFSKIKRFFFIYLALVFILGLGLNFISFSARAQVFHLDIEKARWLKGTTDKFKDSSVAEEKICNRGEDGCVGIDVSKFLKEFGNKDKVKEGDFLQLRSRTDDGRELWVPTSIRGVTFRGTWKIHSDKEKLGSPPDLLKNANLEDAKGDYYVVEEGIEYCIDKDIDITNCFPDPNIISSEDCSSSKNQELLDCDDDTVWRKGDWAIWDGKEWGKISYTGKIESFFGRGGIVSALNDDYTWDQIDKEVSYLKDLTDISKDEVEGGNFLIWRKVSGEETFWWTPEPIEITTEMIEDNEIITSKIMDDSINRESIEDNAVITTKLAESSIIANNISNYAVTSEIIEDGALITAKLGNGSVTEDKMKDSLAVSSKIQNYAITKEKIFNGAVIEEKIKDAAITKDKILNGSVVTRKIKNSGISSNDLKNGVITTDLVPSQSVLTEKIGNGAIISSKIQDGNVLSAKIAVAQVTESKILNGAILTKKLGSNAVATDKIANEAVTSPKIKKEEVVTSKIATNAVTTAKIPDGAITAIKLTNEAVTTDKLADGAITISKIASDAVITDKFKTSAVTTAKIPDGEISTTKIDKEAVTTEKIANGTLGDGNFSDLGSINRSKIQSGSGGSVVYNDDSTGKLTQESSLSIKRGGSGGSNTQEVRTRLGIRPGVDINAHHVKLDDVSGMSMEAGDVLLGGDPSFKLALHNSGEVRDSFELGSAGQLKVKSNGNVGISQEPTSKLDVNGDSKFRNDLDLNSKKIRNVSFKSSNVGSSSQCAVLFRDASYKSSSWSFCPGSPIPSSASWNNQGSSLTLPSGGVLKACTNPDGTGSCTTYNSSTSWVGDDVNDKISYLDYSIGSARIITGAVDQTRDLLNKGDVDLLFDGKSFGNTGLKYLIRQVYPSTGVSWSDCKSSEQNVKTVCGSVCPTGKKCFVSGYRYGFHGGGHCPNNTAPSLRCRRMCHDKKLAAQGKYAWGFYEHCGNNSDSTCINHGCSKSKPETSCRKTSQGTVYKFEFPRTHQYYCYKIDGSNSGKVNNSSPLTVSGKNLTNTFGSSISKEYYTGGFVNSTIQIAPASKDHFYKVKVYGVCNNVDGISSSSKCSLELEQFNILTYKKLATIAVASVNINSQFYMEAYFQVEKSATAGFTVINRSGGTRYFTDVHYVLIRLK